MNSSIPWSLFLIWSCQLVSATLHGDNRRVSEVKLGVQDDPSPTPAGVPESWFQQKLDHFNPADDRYWKNRYFVNSTYYRPGGPAFLFIGGEGGLNEIYARTGAWLEYAKEYNAICFALEHRYYGKSHPTSDLSTANLQHMTVEQTLADQAYFITQTNKHSNMTGTKWVVFGGSYAGALAAWVRYKFPHLVVGAVADSATVAIPVLNTAYAVGMGEALNTVPGCSDAVKAAFDEMQTNLKTVSGTKHLMDLFRMCDFNGTNKLDIQNFMFNMVLSMSQVVQYSSDNMGYLTGRPQESVKDMCAGLDDKTKGPPLARLAGYLAHLSSNYTYLNGSCFPVSFDSLLEQGKHLDYEHNEDLISGRQWNYQLCTQIGNWVASEGENQPFGQALSGDLNLKICEGYFGSKFTKELATRGNEELKMRYAGLDIKATHVVYTQGSLDPFRKNGLNKDDVPGSHVIVIPGVGHVADMLSSSPLDSPELKQAREKIKRYIGQWIS